MLQLRTAIKRLHARKDKAYAGAWKRRGEQISILPNIARKVDRLAAFASAGTTLEDESILDTAIDLHVYSLKYELFLAEQEPRLLRELSISQPLWPLSERSENLDALVDATAYDDDVAHSSTALADKIHEQFERLWPAAANDAAIDERFAMARELAAVSAMLIARLARDAPEAVERFVRAEQDHTG